MTRRGRWLTIGVMTALCAWALACRPPEPVTMVAVHDAWARPADSAATTAVYLVMVNHDTAAITLSAVTSPASPSVSLHETMVMSDMVMSDMVHMSPLSGPLTISAGDSLVLRPGAKHLMLTSLRRSLAVADTVALALTLTDGRVLPVLATVRTP